MLTYFGNHFFATLSKTSYGYCIVCKHGFLETKIRF